MQIIKKIKWNKNKASFQTQSKKNLSNESNFTYIII